MEPFKNLYNKQSITLLAETITSEYILFDNLKFIKKCLNRLDDLEMKDRVRSISSALETFLPSEYKEANSIIRKVIKSKKLKGFILWPISHYIEVNGINHFKLSMDTFSLMTEAFSAEFGVRPFYEKYPEKTLTYMEKLSKHSNEHLRRWASEGIRPNLPWGINVSHIEGNLKKHITILNNLNSDDSLYVRKSVANHMSDITWINESLALKTLKKWNKSKSSETKWIIKQALRGLIKRGSIEALSLLGYKSDLKLKKVKFVADKKEIKEGESLNLAISFQLDEIKDQLVMVDYRIHYLKSNHKVSPKVFKGKSLTLKSNESFSFSKKISFKKVTTRTHYKGVHKVELLINGKVYNKTSIKLI